MLIVCPTCATSYMIDPASLGAAGRTVRCARCKASWFAGGPKTAAVGDFVDDVIAEAEARTAPPAKRSAAPPPSAKPRPSPRSADDFGAEPVAPVSRADAQPAHEEPFPPHDDLPPVGDETGIPVAEAPPLVPPMETQPLPEPGHAELDSDDVEGFAQRRARMQAKRKKKRRSSKWTAIILVLLGFNVALLGARNEVVRYVPQTASLFAAIGLPVNLRHLTFEDVRVSKEDHDGVNVMVVEGAIVSSAREAIEVPRLRFAARNATGQEVYSWTALPARSIIGPGERLPFRSRLASPPAEANDVLVRFFTARDAGSGVEIAPPKAKSDSRSEPKLERPAKSP